MKTPLARVVLLTVVALAVGWVWLSPTPVAAPAVTSSPARALEVVTAPRPPAGVPSAAAAPAPVVAAEPAPKPRLVTGEVQLPAYAEPAKKRAASAQLRKMGEGLFKRKRFADVQPLYELAVRLDPDSPAAAEHLGSVLARNGDASRAVFFYDRFLELAPNDPLAIDLKSDVDAYLKDHPNPALQLMRDGQFRQLSAREAALQSELARRMVSSTDVDADLAWFLAELELQRQRGEIGPLVNPP